MTMLVGSGPPVVTVQPILQSPNNLIWNGVPLQYSAQGTLSINISGIRANATGFPVASQIVAQLSMSSGSLLITQSSLVVGPTELGLYAGNSGQLSARKTGRLCRARSGLRICSLAGRRSRRRELTEGYAGAFAPRFFPVIADTPFVGRSGNALSRALFGLPAGCSIVRAERGRRVGCGSADVPEGIWECQRRAGFVRTHTPWIAAVGAGGGCGRVGRGRLDGRLMPGDVRSGTLDIRCRTELQISSGSAYAVYEVLDSNPFTLESAQFPTFLGLAPNAVSTAVETFESVSFAPT